MSENLSTVCEFLVTWPSSFCCNPSTLVDRERESALLATRDTDISFQDQNVEENASGVQAR